MRVAIFENEFKNLKASFDAVNLLYFDEKLVFELFNSSQAFGDINNVKNYKFVIIDIDLSPKSELDGYQLISQILNLKISGIKIVILTGHINIEEQLEKKSLPVFPIISKPITYEGIRTALTK